MRRPYLNRSGSSTPAFPRDLAGYEGHPPVVSWPGGAKLALSFVLNYEEGGGKFRAARR